MVKKMSEQIAFIGNYVWDILFSALKSPLQDKQVSFHPTVIETFVKYIK